MSPESFGEVDGGRGAAFGEEVEEDVGIEPGGVGDGGDCGEEGAALFARGAVGEVVDRGRDDDDGARGEHGCVAGDVFCNVFALGAGPGEENDEIGVLEGDNGAGDGLGLWYFGFVNEYRRGEVFDARVNFIDLRD